RWGGLAGANESPAQDAIRGRCLDRGQCELQFDEVDRLGNDDTLPARSQRGIEVFGGVRRYIDNWCGYLLHVEGECWQRPQGEGSPKQGCELHAIQHRTFELDIHQNRVQRFSALADAGAGLLVVLGSDEIMSGSQTERGNLPVVVLVLYVKDELL